MQIKRIVVGELQENCYIVYDHQRALIIDPGANFLKIDNFIEEQQLKIDAILLTHGHYDHIGAVDELVAKYHCSIYIHTIEVPMLLNPKLNLSILSSPFIIDHAVINLDEGVHEIGIFEVSWILASGHTEGSTLFIIQNHMFSGDVIFKDGIGRCDLPTGSVPKMRQSLDLLKAMKINYVVHPGHGEETTLFKEQSNLNY